MTVLAPGRRKTITEILDFVQNDAMGRPEEICWFGGGNCCVIGAIFTFVKRKWAGATAAKTAYLLGFLQILRCADAVGDGLAVDIHRNHTICTCMHRSGTPNVLLN
jgi:hypothetical protein